MKKMICYFTVILVLFSALAGCGNKEDQTDTPGNSDDEQSMHESSASIESFSESTIISVSALDNDTFIWAEDQLSAISQLLHEGLKVPLSNEKASTLRSNEFWRFSLITDTGELSANVLAGSDQQGIVHLSTSDGASAAIRSPEMVELLLKGLCVEGPVDQELLVLLQPAIEERIQQMCSMYNEAVDDVQYIDGQVVQLEPIYQEAGTNGEEYYLFSSDVAMICKYPENIQLFDGMWVDDQGRMRDHYNWAYITAEIKDGAAVHTAFLLGDEVVPDGSEEELRDAMMSALSRENMEPLES